MGRIFTVPLSNLSVTNDADQDIIEMVNGSGVTAILHEIELNSALTTDERVRLRLCRRSTTGSGGTALTEAPGSVGDAGAALAVSALVTAPGTIGAILEEWYWSQLAPFVYIPVPEGRFTIPPSGRLCLNLLTAVASTRSWSGRAKWEEVG
jgi:hypothetical protein